MENIEPIIEQLQTTTRLFQAIGGLILAYIIFNIINTVIAKKKRNELRAIKYLIEKIDRNIEKLSKRK